MSRSSLYSPEFVSGGLSYPSLRSSHHLLSLRFRCSLCRRSPSTHQELATTPAPECSGRPTERKRRESRQNVSPSVEVEVERAVLRGKGGVACHGSDGGRGRSVGRSGSMAGRLLRVARPRGYHSVSGRSLLGRNDVEGDDKRRWGRCSVGRPILRSYTALSSGHAVPPCFWSWTSRCGRGSPCRLAPLSGLLICSTVLRYRARADAFGNQRSHVDQGSKVPEARIQELRGSGSPKRRRANG